MDLTVRLAMTGAREAMLSQAVNANNLANAGAAGFRADLLKFGSQVVDGSGKLRLHNAVDFSQGELQTTGRPLDVAVDGDGWIAVQAKDGTQAYSRRGDLRVDASGQLTNGAGEAIMGNSGPIALPPFSKIAIGQDGTISIRPLGEAPAALAVVDRIKLVKVNDSHLTKGKDGLLRLPAGEKAKTSTDVHLMSGVLEGSNVNPVEAMVRMIDLARGFEQEIRMMATSDKNDQAMMSVMRMNS